MRAMTVVGWIVAPYFMLPALWKKLPGGGKAWGSLWTVILLAIIIAALLQSYSGGNPTQKVQAKAIRATTEQASPANAHLAKDGNNN